MYLVRTVQLLGAVALVASQAQVPLSGSGGSQHKGPWPLDDASDHYTFKWPIRKVAIIGAGPSGVLSYREFTKLGFEVHLFERDHGPGGNWVYSEDVADPAPIPNADISIGDFVPSLPPKGAQLPYEEVYHGRRVVGDLVRRHRGPKPIWNTLHSNAPAPLQQFTDLPWPKGTEWELPHFKLKGNIRAFASFHGINANDDNPRVKYNTRVELVEKRYDAHGAEAGWTLTLKTVERTGRYSAKATWRTEDFDAIVVGAGRYNAPNIPRIPGLKEWADRFPGNVQHSRAYRRPEPFKDKTVLIVGAATSGAEIARDLNPHVAKTYQSIRPDTESRPHLVRDLVFRRLPANATIVPEIKRFLPPGRTINTSRVELSNGTTITGIDEILFATGFRYTFPFLRQYINSSVTTDRDADSAHPRPIITDGTHLRSLYLDILYIEEPTIGFVNMNIGGLQSFTYAEYVAVALSKVWAGLAHLPNSEELWRRQAERVEDLKGYGRHFQYVGGGKSKKQIRFLVGWLNGAAAKYGGRQIDGLHPDSDQINDFWNKARFGRDIYRGDVPGVPPSNFTSKGGEDWDRFGAQVVTERDAVDWYNDAW